MERDARLRTAAEIMTRAVYALRPEMPAREAAVALIRRGYSGAPVIDATRRLVGIVSERDLIRALAATAYDAVPDGTVGTLMTRGPTTASPEADVFDLAAKLERAGVRRLPIVDDGLLVGLVSRRDVARALAEMCAERCAAESLSTIDAIAQLEGTHNPLGRGPLSWNRERR